METSFLVRPPESFSIKSGKVVLQPRECVGEHKTEKREEVIVIIKGRALVIKEGKRMELEEGEACYIKEGTKHNVINLSEEKPLEYYYIVSILGH